MAALARFIRAVGIETAEVNPIRGVVHCTAVVWDGEIGRTLRVAEVSPASLGEDPFVLQFCRASADALVQTGTNMRTEPGFWPTWASAMLEEHRAHLGKRPAPLPVVLLTRGAPPSPPSAFLAEWGNDIAVRVPRPTAPAPGGGSDAPEPDARTHSRAQVCGPPGVAEALRASVTRELGQEAAHIVAGLEQSRLGPADAIEFAQRQYGDTVLVEAGPTTTGALYPEGGPSGVDMVMLSEVEGPVPEEALGPPSVSRRMLGARPDLECVAEYRSVHPPADGRQWTYSLWQRWR